MERQQHDTTSLPVSYLSNGFRTIGLKSPPVLLTTFFVRLPVNDRPASVSQAAESETSEDEEEYNTLPTVEATPEAGTAHQERREGADVRIRGHLC